jgi:iron(III) transport system permease protein
VNALDPTLLGTVLPNTIYVGFGTAAFVTLFALPMAWLLFRTDIPYKPLWISLMSATVVIPGFVKAMGWIMLINPNMGLINNFLSAVTGIDTIPWNIESLWGIAFLQGLMYTPIMFFLLSGPMQALDPALEEAAAMSGARQWETLSRIALPLMWPAILGGLIYVSMLSISAFDVAAMLGGFNKNPVLATAMFLKIQGLGGMTTPDYGVGSVYGLLILAPSIVGLYFYFRVIERQHRYAVITGRGYRPTLVSLGKAKPFALTFVIGYLGLSVGFPFLVLLWQSLLPYLQFPSKAAFEVASFENYTEVFDYIGSNVLSNTILLVVFASVITAFFSIMISWVVVKTKIRSRHTLDVLAMIPHAVPGLVFAFLILVIAMMARKYLPGVPLYGTLFIVILAHVINRVSYFTRVTNASFMQISPELEESALVSGAKRITVIWLILAPLVKGSVLFTTLWTAMLVFKDLTIALVLLGPSNSVLSIQVWNAWGAGDLNTAAAMGVIMVLVMGALVMLAWLIGQKPSRAKAST